MVIRDLRVYAQAAGARVYHYRDNTGLEVDAIVEGSPGRWAGFEIKLGTGRIEEAAANLLQFAQRVDPAALGKPAALGVIVGSGYGYRRSDGVWVIPRCAGSVSRAGGTACPRLFGELGLPILPLRGTPRREPSQRSGSSPPRPCGPLCRPGGRRSKPSPRFVPIGDGSFARCAGDAGVNTGAPG